MSEVFKFLHKQKRNYRRQKNRGDFWLEPGSPLLDKFPQYRSEYRTPSETFKKLLKPHNDLQGFIEDRKKHGGDTHIIDFFGSGNFVKDFSSVDSLTGVRISDISHQEEIDKRPENYSVLEGNLYSRKTWIDIEKYIRDKNIPAIDIAVCRAGGAFVFEKDLLDRETFDQEAYFKVFYILLRKVYAILSSNNGILFTEVPNVLELGTKVEQPIISEQLFKTWINKLKQQGIEIEHDGYQKLKIIKTKNAPEKLLLF